MYEAQPVTDNVFWVGAIDWNVRDFHGYTTGRGATYNAYLVKGEKTALVDTVKAEFFHEMIWIGYINILPIWRLLMICISCFS